MIHPASARAAIEATVRIVLTRPAATCGLWSGRLWTGTAWRLGVSGRNRCLGERIVGGLESLSEAGAERAVIDGAANLKHKIRPSPRPAHLLRFVHPAVHSFLEGAMDLRCPCSP